MSTAATIRKLWIGIICGANGATILLLWSVCLSTCLEPSAYPRLSQAGLLFPIFLYLNLFYIVVWLLTSRKWVILPIIGLLPCASYIIDYCPVNLHEDIPDNSITVLSYNTGFFTPNDENKCDVSNTAKYIEDYNADIICLQECPTETETGRQLVGKMDSLGYNKREHGGKVIFTKWNFLGKAVLESNGGGNGLMAWYISNGKDTLLLVNVHLQSNHFNPEEKKEYKEAITGVDGHMIKNTGNILLSKLSSYASQRQMQVDSLCQLIGEHHGDRILICGDMNDTPISYTCRQISKRLTSAFRQSGSGVGISYNQEWFPIRIDHIFLSSNLKSHETYIDHSILSSDHYPIVSHVSLLPKTEE